MLRKKKTVIKTLLVSIICCVIFAVTGYVYISSNTRTANNVTPKVSYYTAVPDDAGIVFEIGGVRTFFCLNFAKEEMAVMFLGDEEVTNGKLYGYNAKYTVKGEKELLSGIIDGLDGIVMNVDGEELNCTGVQVADMLSKSGNSDTLVREITASLLKKIAETGFKKDNLLYIIENGNTNLTVPLCYNWSEYMQNICKSVRVVN